MIDDDEMKLKRYYKDRAPMYDCVYTYPERQEDLRFLEDYIPSRFTGLDILEVAAGTGYWTQFLSCTARSILATDTASEALQQIYQRPLQCPVQLELVDAYALDRLPSTFDGAFAGLWFSHVPKQRMYTFLDALHARLASGAVVMFLDNSLAQCARLPISETDEFGNTYQHRTLEGGRVYRVLKNFPSQTELMGLARGRGTNAKYLLLQHFWLFQYESL
jgi:demethylmenaquinone methyltransferase/2-methoxy-6-polyprenyl-1,4-benzoquinol methylase